MVMSVAAATRRLGLVVSSEVRCLSTRQPCAPRLSARGRSVIRMDAVVAGGLVFGASAGWRCVVVTLGDAWRVRREWHERGRSDLVHRLVVARLAAADSLGVSRTRRLWDWVRRERNWVLPERIPGRLESGGS